MSMSRNYCAGGELLAGMLILAWWSFASVRAGIIDPGYNIPRCD
ncbi:MAG: hypothetical protein QOG27_1036 [Verrucomicrobiota bacterium]